MSHNTAPARIVWVYICVMGGSCGRRSVRRWSHHSHKALLSSSHSSSVERGTPLAGQGSSFTTRSDCIPPHSHAIRVFSLACSLLSPSLPPLSLSLSHPFEVPIMLWLSSKLQDTMQSYLINICFAAIPSIRRVCTLSCMLASIPFDIRSQMMLLRNT